METPVGKPIVIGSEIRFREDLEIPYMATVVDIDESQVPNVLTVSVIYDDCVVVTKTTEDDAYLRPHPLV